MSGSEKLQELQVFPAGEHRKGGVPVCVCVCLSLPELGLHALGIEVDDSPSA